MHRNRIIGLWRLIFVGIFLIASTIFIKEYLSLKKAASTYNNLREEYPFNSSVTETKEVYPQLKNIKDEYPETVAWLIAEGTNIDYPVMHTNDNNYYLNHLYNGEENEYGALFVDYRNNNDLSDKNIVIYGHHMKNGTMFGSLDEYRSQDFYEAAPEMLLYTEEETYLIELISGTIEDGDEEFVRFVFDDESDFLNYIAEQKNRSTFKSSVEVSADDRIVSLCTCSTVRNNARYLVIGKLTKLDQ